MSQRRLQSKHSQPFVRLGTIRDMTSVARKLAMVRAAVQEIGRIEGELLKVRDERQTKKGLLAMAETALKAQKWSEEAVVTLQEIKRNVEGFLREARHGAD